VLGTRQSLNRPLPGELTDRRDTQKHRHDGSPAMAVAHAAHGWAGPPSSIFRTAIGTPMTRQTSYPYLLIAPSLVFLVAFFLFPLVQTIWLSFASTGGVGLENYRRMLGDLNFGTAVRNTFALTLVAVPIQIALAITMAVMVQKLERGRDFILWIWTIPLAVSDLAAGLAWLAILQNSGYLNSLLFSLGIIPSQSNWLTYETPIALFCGIAIAEIWRATAIVFVILLAGLQLIPKEYNEAAEIFGASPWTRFKRITLPLLRPSIQSALILRTVLAFEVFAVVYALGGRNFPVLAGEAYTWQRDNQNDGVAAAIAVLIMLISLLATAAYLKLLHVNPEQQP
jgi:multiple sugar transport system permease protein